MNFITIKLIKMFFKILLVCNTQRLLMLLNRILGYNKQTQNNLKLLCKFCKLQILCYTSFTLIKILNYNNEKTQLFFTCARNI